MGNPVGDSLAPSCTDITGAGSQSEVTLELPAGLAPRWLRLVVWVSPTLWFIGVVAIIVAIAAWGAAPVDTPAWAWGITLGLLGLALLGRIARTFRPPFPQVTIVAGPDGIRLGERLVPRQDLRELRYVARNETLTLHARNGSLLGTISCEHATAVAILDAVGVERDRGVRTFQLPPPFTKHVIGFPAYTAALLIGLSIASTGHLIWGPLSSVLAAALTLALLALLRPASLRIGRERLVYRYWGRGWSKRLAAVETVERRGAWVELRLAGGERRRFAVASAADARYSPHSITERAALIELIKAGARIDDEPDTAA